MANFNFASLVTESILVSAALGVDAAHRLDSNDAGKAVKLGVAQNYVLCATGDDIEGVLVSVEAHTVNDGFSFGSVKEDGMVEAQVSSAEGGAIDIGDTVVSGVPVAANTAGALMVISGAGVTYKWRVVRHITGSGVPGDTILIKRV